MSKKHGRSILVDRIPETLYQEFQALTRRRGASMAGMIRDMLAERVFEDKWQNEGGTYDVGTDPEKHKPSGRLEDL